MIMVLFKKEMLCAKTYKEICGVTRGVGNGRVLSTLTSLGYKPRRIEILSPGQFLPSPLGPLPKNGGLEKPYSLSLNMRYSSNSTSAFGQSKFHIMPQ